MPTSEQIAEAENLWTELLSLTVPTYDEQEDICKLHTYMEVFQIPVKAIRNLLLKTGAVIGGSLPLQAILHTHWVDSDMDIYLVEDKTCPIMQWHGLLTAFGYKLCSSHSQEYTSQWNSRLQNTIIEVRSYELFDLEMIPRKIQIISCINIPYVLNKVDLSCVTVFYNGKRLVALEDIALIRAKIAYIRFPLHHLTIHEATIRILKYTARGFIILNYERKSPYTGWKTESLARVYYNALNAQAASNTTEKST